MKNKVMFSSLTILAMCILALAIPAWAIGRLYLNMDQGRLQQTNTPSNWFGLTTGDNWRVNKAPVASATQACLSVGAKDIAGGNAATNGGTYIGINAPSSGAGVAADFINFQANGVEKFGVDLSGNLTCGTITGSGFSSSYNPAVDNTSSLGTHALRYKNLHMASVIYGDGGLDVYTPGALAIGAQDATSVVVTPPMTTTGALSAVGGIKLTEGSNKRAGTAALTSGWTTVANTSVGANTRILVTGQNTTGACYVKSRVNSTSFAIYSTDGADTGNVYWELKDNN